MQDNTRIVGIGASAGGLQAIESLLGTLPSDTGLAFVIVQHLSIDYDSNLAVILSRATEMKVTFLREDTAPRPNTVYIRPADKELTVKKGRLLLSPREQENDYVYLPIDHFLLSLAVDQESYGIAVILSGMGSDGSRGLKAVKESGGIVLVQSPHSAQFSGMPAAAIRFEVADYIGSPKELAQTITSIALREPGPNQVKVFQELAQPEFEGFIAEIIRRINEGLTMDFSHYRPSTIRRRIEKRLLIHMIDQPTDYLELLDSKEEELQILAQSFLIGVTRFFRDPQAFELIERKVLPQLVASAVPDRPLRIWVPACSTGEEAYSIAMVLDDYLSVHGKGLDYKILASDVDPKAIKVAGEGFYQENIFADIPERYLKKYLQHTHGGYRVVPRLREKILFAIQNLLTDPPFIHIDFLSCRNFLIYIDAAAQAGILSNFHFSLNPEGFMMLGPSESLGRMQQAFSSIDRRWKIFTPRPIEKRHLDLSKRSRLSIAARENNVGMEDNIINQVSSRENYRASNFDEFAQYLAGQYAPACLFLNQAFEIAYINGNLDAVLHFPKFHTEFVLDKVLDNNTVTLLRAGIDALFSSENQDANSEISVDALDIKGITYQAMLSQVELDSYPGKLVMIQISPKTLLSEDENPGKPLKADQLLQRRIHTLEERLILSEQRARKLLTELEATNEELQTSNRELLASNEEMQSTNEELQSVNEELYTVNQEMQFKNEQLKTLNNDINQLLESTEIGTIFLDRDMIIRRFTPSIRRQFDLHETDISRPLSAFSSSFTDLHLTDNCRQVLDTRQRYEEEIIDSSGRHYLLRILPHLIPDKDEGIGLIITFIDINELVEARQELSETAAKYEVLLNYSENSIALVSQRARIEQINRWISPDVPVENLLGAYIVDVIEDDVEQLKFHNALRSVFDEKVAITEKIKISGEGESAVYAEITFIPNPARTNGSHGSREDQAILIMRDVSSEVIELQNTLTLLEQYRKRLRATETQAGLMDLDGNILDLNKSHEPYKGPEDFIQKNIREFLTESGWELIKEALSRIENGSYREVVVYQKEDLTISGYGDSLAVAYEPVISGGEIICVTVTNMDEGTPEK
ncbi:CheR family methyltransferase [Neolewinella persica]|uniref:CheR family methyltransferase n=1 Tax=Neolewinella persica TaxID=70998 RepID=UPI0003A799A0|nr:CheR family methyltransferase [Neolewinella persica]